jgi:hypothetical protein
MALTAIEEVREWTGRVPTDAEIVAALDRFDADPLLAARSILRRHLADLAMVPSDLAADQDSRKWMEWQVELLERRIEAVASATDDEESDSGLAEVTVGVISRPGLGR